MNKTLEKSCYRYIIIGDTEVGKSSILLQFTERQFSNAHDMTIGVEMGNRTVMVDNRQIRLEIWDTAGQESYLSITRSYYRGSDGCLLVYDISSRSSFESIPMWLSEARQNSNNPNLVILMIGNKADLVLSRKVSFAEATEFAAANGLLFLELTAKNHQEVEKAFLQTANGISKRIAENGRARDNGIRLGGQSNEKQNKQEKAKLNNLDSCCK